MYLPSTFLLFKNMNAYSPHVSDSFATNLSKLARPQALGLQLKRKSLLKSFLVVGPLSQYKGDSNSDFEIVLGTKKP